MDRDKLLPIPRPILKNLPNMESVKLLPSQNNVFAVVQVVQIKKNTVHWHSIEALTDIKMLDIPDESPAVSIACLKCEKIKFQSGSTWLMDVKH